MLYRFCGKFLEYCRLADFSDRSIQALEIRLGELRCSFFQKLFPYGIPIVRTSV
jgi:hypothetical protein